MKKIRVGIAGGSGYTGGELIRLLLNHPSAQIEFVQSDSNAGKPVHSVHTDLLGETDLRFAANPHHNIDILFLCGGHDTAKKFICDVGLPLEVSVIDLSHDFRHKESNVLGSRTFVYGLPELNRDKIKTAKNIANPGCFATCIELALLPLAGAKKMNGDINITATTGSTGAGQAPGSTTHFSWRSNNLSVYKAFEHQHLKEITESLTALQPELNGEILFVPQRGSFTRGIFACAVVKTGLELPELTSIYNNYYVSHPFIMLSENEVDIKQVVNTNRCFIHLAKRGENVLITSVIDNLLKGASGQALQNMNLIFGLDEKAGLQLKPSAF